jgi:hypothetical protein
MMRACREKGGRAVHMKRLGLFHVYVIRSIIYLFQKGYMSYALARPLHEAGALMYMAKDVRLPAVTISARRLSVLIQDEARCAARRIYTFVLGLLARSGILKRWLGAVCSLTPVRRSGC